MLFVVPQAIQDITRNRDIVPEEIVALIFEKIDVNGEGEHHLTESKSFVCVDFYSFSELITSPSAQSFR